MNDKKVTKTMTTPNESHSIPNLKIANISIATTLTISV